MRETRQKERDNELYAESGDSLRIQKQLSHLRSERSAVQSKLDKLLQFNASSSSVFSKADDSASLVSEAEATISASFGAKSFSMPANASWVNTVRGQWSDREQGVTKRYEAALAKVQNGESLTPEDVTAIERYQATYPDKVNQEAVKAAEAYRVESCYQAAVSKVNNGQELSQSDVQAIEAYQKAHPDAKIDKKVIKAKEAYVIKKEYQDVVEKLKSGESLTDEDLTTIENYAKNHPNEKLDSVVSNYLSAYNVENVSSIGKGVSYVSTSRLAGVEALASIKKIKNGTWWRKPVSTTYSKTGYKTWKQVSGDVSRFKNVKAAKNADDLINGAGKIAKGSGAKGAFKSVGALGGSMAVLDGVSTYYDRVDEYGVTGAAIDGAAHTATAVGSIYVGAAIDSAIPIPVVGTVVGAVAGYVFGGIVNTLYDGFVRNDWDGDNWALW